VQGFCPHCEDQRELKSTYRTLEYEIRGEHIEVETPVVVCNVCGNESEPYDSDFDPLDVAYREYRQGHRMLQPEQIVDFRRSTGLSQKELSKLLGWGGATLSRYENGALQDEAHDKALQLAMEPRALMALVEAKPQALAPDKLEKLTLRLRQQLGNEEVTFRRLYEERFGNYQPDALSGFRKLNLEKLFNAIVFFCIKTGTVKTKLNKLLFYADFKHFKDYMVSITGVRYAHLPYGPVPDNYAFYLAALTEEEKALIVDEKPFGDYVGEVLVALRSPDISVFSPSELKILALVKERFDGKSARELSERSHREQGYVQTRNGELISYEYASELSI